MQARQQYIDASSFHFPSLVLRRLILHAGSKKGWKQEFFIVQEWYEPMLETLWITVKRILTVYAGTKQSTPSMSVLHASQKCW